MYRTAISVGCALLSLLFSSCGKKSESGQGELRFGMEKDFVTLDPANLTDPITFRIVGQIYESLLSLDDQNQAVPAIAESWKSNESADVWTFRIRRGVYFHESSVFGSEKTRELTPDDVVYSISRSVSPGKVAGFALGNVIEGASAYMSGEASEVSGLRVIGEDSVEITLTRPEPYFSYRLTSPYIAIYPEEAVAQGEDVFAKSRPLGTGPYRVASASDTEIELIRHEKYWGEVSEKAPERVNFVVVGNDQLRQIELRNGKLDVAVATPAMMPAIFEKPASPGAGPVLRSDWADRTQAYTHADFNSYFIAFNTEKVPSPIRRAVNLAIDREEIAAALSFGTALPKWNTVPNDLQGYQPPFELPAPDLETARKVLDDAKAEGDKGGFELIVHELDSSETLGELLQSRMKSVGIEVTITKVTFNEAMRRLIAGDYQAMTMKFQYIYSAPAPILSMMFSTDQIPGSNVCLYRSPEVERLLASYAETSSREELNRISGQIEKQVYEDAAGVFIYQAQTTFLHNPQLKNLSVNGHGIPLLYQSSLATP